ncbi:hypothetical protein V8F33_002723 [Rhypophila sp. PSN 637]
MVTTRGQASQWKPPSSPGPGESENDPSSDDDIPATTSTARQTHTKPSAALRPPPRDGTHMHSLSPLKRKQHIANNARATKRQKRTTTATTSNDDASKTAQFDLGIINAAFGRPQRSRMVIPIPTSGQLLAKKETSPNTRSDKQQHSRRGRSAGLSTRDRTPMSMDKSPPRGKILSSERNHDQADEEEEDQDVERDNGSSNRAEAPSGRSRVTLEKVPTDRAKNERLYSIQESPQVQDSQYEHLDRLIQFIESPTIRGDLYQPPIVEENSDEEETDQVRQQLEHVYETDISPADMFETAQPAKETQYHTAVEQGSPDLGSGFDIDNSYNDTATNNEKPSGGAAQISSYENFATQPAQPEFLAVMDMDTSRLTQGSVGPDGMYRDARGKLPNGLHSVSPLETPAPPSGQGQVMKSSPPLVGSQFVELADQIDENGRFFFSEGSQEAVVENAQQTREESRLFVSEDEAEPEELLAQPDEDDEDYQPRQSEEDEEEEEEEEVEEAFEQVEQVGEQQQQEEEEEEAEEDEVEEDVTYAEDQRAEEQEEGDVQDTTDEPEPVQQDSPPPLPSLPAHLRRNTRLNPPHTNGTFGTNGILLDDPFRNSNRHVREQRLPRASTRPAHRSSTMREERSSRTEGSMTARETSRTVGSARASTATRVIHTPETTGPQKTITLPSKLVTKMHKLMGGTGWTELNKTWSVDLFQPDPFNEVEDDDDHVATPAITWLGASLFKYLVTLKNKFYEAPAAPDLDGLNQWVGENEEWVDNAMEGIGKFVKRICEERLAVLGDSTRPTGNNLENRKALTRDLVLCVMPLMVDTLWWAFALGGIEETTEDDLSGPGPRADKELPNEGEFTAVGLQYLVRITGWLVRLEGVLMFELEARPFYQDWFSGSSQTDTRRAYRDNCKKKRTQLGKLLREWNGELNETVGDLKYREEKEQKMLASLRGQSAVIEARKRDKEREEKENRRQMEAFMRSTHDVKRELEKRREERIRQVQQGVRWMQPRQYIVVEDDEDEDEDPFASPVPRRQPQDDDEDPFASPVPRSQPRQAPAPAPPPRYTPWTYEELRLLLTEIRRTKPGQPLATKQDYEDMAEAWDKSLEGVMYEAARLRKAQRTRAEERGGPIPRWALEE